MSGSFEEEKTRIIAALNDEFRKSFIGGEVYITVGLNELGSEFVVQAVDAVKQFDAFTSEYDPYGEHDFGSLNVQEHKLFWKIDYYDPTMKFGSEDPSNAELTKRVLTVMLAGEY